MNDELQRVLLGHIGEQQAALALEAARLSRARQECSQNEALLRMAQAKLDLSRTNMHNVQSTHVALTTTLEQLRSTFMLDLLMRSIPEDVLLGIFSALSTEPDDLWSIPLPGCARLNLARATVPFTLSGVCRRWRRVALSSPSLWAYVGVGETDGRSNEHLYRQYDRIQLSLTRSKQNPLHIVLGFDCAAVKSISPSAHIVEAIAGQAARWAQVAFLNSDSSIMAKALKGPTPLLTHLRVAGSVPDITLPFAPRLVELQLNFDKPDWSLQVTSSLPCLVSLSIYDFAMVDSDSLVHLLSVVHC